METLLIEFLLLFTTPEALNGVLSDPRLVATLVGVLVAISGALLGTFLLLRRMSLMTDAISHTILLGIVVAFMVLLAIPGLEPDLSSPWLILGAAGAGLITVILTETLTRSGLVKADAALGLAFPLLFAISVILISRYMENVHLDTDAVIVGEIGLVWANTHSHCLERCDPITITPEDTRAEVRRVCLNCTRGGIGPRDPEAIFEERCDNCRTYSAAEAWGARLIDTPPSLVYFPKALGVMSMITLVNLLFVIGFYKELKLSTFDPALARSLGLRPGLIHYALMLLVSVTAVGAFDAVGSILVIAFFIVPAAAAYLLTDRLAGMLLIAPIIGGLSAYFGYDLARGRLFGLEVSDLLQTLDPILGLDGYTTWNVSISASMVIVLFLTFMGVWIASPRYGLIANSIRRSDQQRRFREQMILGHIANHPTQPEERKLSTLHHHFGWPRWRMAWVIFRLRSRGAISVQEDLVELTEPGQAALSAFRQINLPYVAS